MPPDLSVDKIVLPTLVTAPCPQQLEVVVRNIGSDPAPYPFEVCLSFDDGHEQGAVRELSCTVNPVAEGGGALAVNDTVTCTYDVAFPCKPHNDVRAVADCRRIVPHNLRTNADVTLPVSVVLVPWLVTDLRIGMQDSSGAISWDPTMLCANLPLIAQVSVANRGCADAPASTTDLTITGPSGQLASASWPTTKLSPGKSATFQQVFKLPAPPPAAVTIQACADTGGVVAGQCDTSGLCVSKALPVSPTAGSPTLSLAVDGGAVKPGEVPFVSWQLTNDCSDLGGAVTAAVFFGSDQLYPTSASIPVAPLGIASEVHKQLTVSASAAAKLFVVGQHTLELRVTSSTTPAKTFIATAQLKVVPDPIGFIFSWTKPTVTFSFLTGFSGIASWHQVYKVAAAVTNSTTFSTLTVAGIIIAESTTTPGISAAGAMAVSPPGAAAPGAAAAFELPPPDMLKAWAWIDPTTFDLSGPTSVVFSYDAAFKVTDEFGNGYPPSPLPVPTLFVTVAVSPAKRALQAQAAGELKSAAAALAVAAGSLNPWAAVVGFALWGLAIWHKAQADDPPLPDFGYDERVQVVPAVHDLRREDAPPWAEPLAVMLNLLERARAAQEALTRIHAKILGARIDGAAEALRMQAADYRAALARLQAAAAEVENVAALTAEQLATDERTSAEQLAADLEGLRSGATVDATRQAWQDNGLPEEAFEDLHRRTAQLEDVAPLGSMLPVIARHSVELAQALTEESTEVLALADGT
jgi:hypothetical protein